MRAFGLAVFIAVTFTVAAFSQQSQYEEQIDVNAVLLDVVVTDAKGNQMLGLAKEDFVVTEDGVPQEIDSIDYFTHRRLLDQREELAPFKVERVREERYFVFFFDRPNDPGSLFDQLTMARESVRRFIRDEMRASDLVAVAGHDVRLKVYSDFTSDKDVLEKALHDAARFGPGLTKPATAEGISILRHVDAARMMSETGTAYDAIATLADALRPVRARKNLVLFSPGMADHHEIVRDGMLVNRSPNYETMLRSLNAANVSVYGVQIQRNVDTTPMFHQRLGEMAEDTGGKYYQFNTSFLPALERIENANSGYYLLTYRSRHPKGAKGYQKVEVKVNNPEFRVVARSGYQFGS